MFLKSFHHKFSSITKLILLLSLPLFFATCKGDELGFNMTYQRDFEIAAGLGTFDTHVFELNGIPSNKEAFYSLNGITESDITEIIPKEAQLSINFADVDFSFVREVTVEMFTRNDVIGREVFYREEVPFSAGIRIDLIPSLPNVMDLITQEEFNIRVELQLRDISPQFLDARLDFQFLAKLD